MCIRDRVKGTLIARDGAIVNAMIAERLGGKTATQGATAKAADGNGDVKKNGPKRQPKGGQA